MQPNTAVVPDLQDPPLEPIATARPTSEVGSARVRWNLASRILFRFGLIYLVLYYLPFPLTLLPRVGMLRSVAPESIQPILLPVSWVSQGSAWLVQRYEDGIQSMCYWVGQNILQIEKARIIVQRTGSGDTMIRYIENFSYVLLAALGALIWSAIDFRRPNYRRAAAWGHVYVRYALATVLLGYGVAKVPPMQFQPPGPERLLQTVGSMSPMGMLWTFMGSSPAYTMFAGGAEILAALLLFWRRTAMLGALASAGVMLNVAVLNYCYDVPVKLFSTNLFFTSLILLIPDSKRLLNVLVLQRPAPGVDLRRRYPRPWIKFGVVGFKYVVVSTLLSTSALGAYYGWKNNGWMRPKPAICGVYDVKSFQLDGEERPPLLTDASRWRRLVINRGFQGNLSGLIQGMDDKRQWCQIKHSPEENKLEITSGGAPMGVFTYTEPEEGKLVLEGPWRNGSIRVALKEAPSDTFLLTSRGFHWIQEMPFNR